MCLIIFDWNPGKNTFLTLASNRDEFYERKSLSAHYWKDHPHIFGGRDCEMNGTWLAVSTDGKLAAVTNFRAPDTKSYLSSRGEIPVDFLNSSLNGKAFVSELKNKEYAGYNALLFDGKDLVYTSNRSDKQTAMKLAPGRYGLSNHLLNTPWPKVVKAKEEFSQAIQAENHEEKIEKLYSAMSNTTQAPDEKLPITGIPEAFERMVSPIFIKSPSYGTRTTTLIIASKFDGGHIDLYERQFDSHTESFDKKHHTITTKRYKNETR